LGKEGRSREKGWEMGWRGKAVKERGERREVQRLAATFLTTAV